MSSTSPSLLYDDRSHYRGGGFTRVAEQDEIPVAKAHSEILFPVAKTLVLEVHQDLKTMHKMRAEKTLT